MQTTYDIRTLLSRAKNFPPHNPRSSASSFGSWVFKISHDPKREFRQSQEQIRKSQSSPFVEGDIDVLSKLLASERNDKQLKTGWNLVYADNGKDEDESFVASRLVVAGQAVKCRPDGVFRHSSGEILIIERKITTKFECEIPEQSYPNIRAQLWCYAWIDDWANTPKVTLMDDIWRRNKTTGEPCPPKKRRFWERDNEIWLDSEKLFKLYGGGIVSA
jgi:hypothetical protein